MSNINFTNYNNLTRQFTTTELDNILTDLNSKNSYYQSGQDNLIFIRLTEGYLLLIDLNSNTNRKLFELFSFNHAVDNPFQLKLIQNNSSNEFTIDQALLSVGYIGIIPIESLENIFMKLYIKTGLDKLTYSQSEVDTLLSNKENLIQVNGLSINQINLLQSILDGKRNIIDSYTKNEVNDLFTAIIGGAPESLNTLKEISDAIAADPLFYQQIANKIGLETLQSPTENEVFLNIKATDLSQFRIRVSNGILSIQKFDNTGNVITDDWVNLISVTLDPDNNAVLLLGGLNIINLIDTKANISDVYTKTESDNLLNAKQNTINDNDLTISKTSGLQAALDSKRNITDSYNKTEVDNLISTIEPANTIVSRALPEYADEEAARIDNLEKWSFYRTGNQIKLNSYPQAVWAYKSINSSVLASGIQHNNLVFTIEGSFLWDRHGGGPAIITSTFKNNETTVGNILLQKNGGGNIEILIDGVLSTLFNDIGQLSNNVWHKIVISHDATNGLHGWIDGVYKAPTTTQILTWINFNKIDLQLQQVTEGFGETAAVRFDNTNIYTVGSGYVMDMLLDVLPSTKLLINNETAADISGNNVNVSYVNAVTSRLLDISDTTSLTPFDQTIINTNKLSSTKVGVNISNTDISDAPLTVSGTWNNYYKTYKHIAIGETTVHETTTPTGNMAIRMCSDVAGTSQIHFGRTDNYDFNGAIYYSPDNKMQFFTNQSYDYKFCICPNTIMAPNLIEASDDTDAMSKNIPQWGFYRTTGTGTIKIRIAPDPTYIPYDIRASQLVMTYAAPGTFFTFSTIPDPNNNLNTWYYGQSLNYGAFSIEPSLLSSFNFNGDWVYMCRFICGSWISFEFDDPINNFGTGNYSQLEGPKWMYFDGANWGDNGIGNPGTNISGTFSAGCVVRVIHASNGNTTTEFYDAGGSIVASKIHTQSITYTNNKSLLKIYNQGNLSSDGILVDTNLNTGYNEFVAVHGTVLKWNL